MVLTKVCPKCGETKLLEMFPRLSTSKTGRASHCKECKKVAAKASDKTKAAAKAWYEANKERTLEEAKQDRTNNPEKYRALEAAKYERNCEKIKARVLDYQRRVPDVNRRAAKRYRDANPHLGRAKAAKRRAIKLRATPCWAASEFEQFYVAEIYHLAQLRSEMCIEHHVDHIVPLISRKVCGLHCSANLRVIPAPENLAKSNKHWPDMW